MSESLGWIKVHRRVIDSRVFCNAGLFKVWMWCLLKANHKGQWVPIKTGRGTTEVWIEAGQFIFGRNTAAKELKMKPTTVWYRIGKLKSLSQIALKTDTHYTIVTIINWDSYQGVLIKTDNQLTTNCQPTDTNKKEKNVEKKDNRALPYVAIVSYLNEKTGKNFRPTTKTTRACIKARWNEEARLEDFKRVIDLKSNQWLEDPKMEGFLRPQTLFGPKFEAYSNEKDQTEPVLPAYKEYTYD